MPSLKLEIDGWKMKTLMKTFLMFPLGSSHVRPIFRSYVYLQGGYQPASWESRSHFHTFPFWVFFTGERPSPSPTGAPQLQSSSTWTEAGRVNIFEEFPRHGGQGKIERCCGLFWIVCQTPKEKNGKDTFHGWGVRCCHNAHPAFWNGRTCVSFVCETVLTDRELLKIDPKQLQPNNWPIQNINI